jgi:hypothetical protein
VGPALDLLLAVASDVDAEVLQTSANEAIARASPHVHGGGRDWFQLALSEAGGRIFVREDPTAGRLPAACPMRHLVLGGFFCLGWRQEDPSEVRDAAGAAEWWGAVIHFLGHQAYAEATRRWPVGQERAHGEAAAAHEARAEEFAARFGPSLLHDLRRRRLGLRRVARGTRLERDGRRIFAVRDGASSVVNLRAACPCEGEGQRRRVLRACGDHAASAHGLVLSLKAREEAEADFYDWFAERTECCGTMDGCPMAGCGRPARGTTAARA